MRSIKLLEAAVKQIGITSNNGVDAKNIFVQPDGKIIQCGTVNENGSRFFIVRFTIDGFLDSSFGQNALNVRVLHHSTFLVRYFLQFKLEPEKNYIIRKSA